MQRLEIVYAVFIKLLNMVHQWPSDYELKGERHPNPDERGEDHLVECMHSQEHARPGLLHTEADRENDGDDKHALSRWV